MLVFKWIFPSIFPVLSVASDSYWDLSNRHTVFWLNIEIIWLNFSDFFLIACYHRHMSSTFDDSSALMNKQHKARQNSWALRLMNGSIQLFFFFFFSKYRFFLMLWDLHLISYLCLDTLYSFSGLEGKNALEGNKSIW